MANLETASNLDSKGPVQVLLSPKIKLKTLTPPTRISTTTEIISASGEKIKQQKEAPETDLSATLTLEFKEHTKLCKVFGLKETPSAARARS